MHQLLKSARVLANEPFAYSTLLVSCSFSFASKPSSLSTRRISCCFTMLHPWEGQNPIIVKKGTLRHELKCAGKISICAGDIVELLPRKLAFQLRDISCGEKMVLNTPEEKELLAKRKRQELEDEALAKASQAIEDEHGQTSYAAHASGVKLDDSGTSLCSKRDCKQLKFTHGQCPRIFQLLKVKGLPRWANAGCLDIQDVIEGDILFALLSNYMVDIDWLLSGWPIDTMCWFRGADVGKNLLLLKDIFKACPLLERIPQAVIVHGESGGSLDRLKKPSHWLLHNPPLPLSYGTHHSKAMVLLYQTGVRVIVHTANLIYVDWNNKTQGLWMQDFPYKNEDTKGCTSLFEEDFVEYLEALQDPLKETSMKLTSPTEMIRFVTSCYQGENEELEEKTMLKFPVPYKLPPDGYSTQDVPWSWDRHYTKPDTYGELWPRAIKIYGTKQDK
ncbi:hypothetical protein KP509_10G083500 [Ceratopteris richardii]|uniref:Tyrosyl-DNA phosphodiesterase 1 n=1 Tax=Ceratopteris richardii TaxID=49495 RepID=A0A8T2TXM1_CERRI|nr:hypothetical protein KP509_10G083500 [Ceratopteris richardii]